MIYLWLMQQLSRTSGWRIGIHSGKRKFYYLVGSKTGLKYRPWVGMVTMLLMMILMYVAMVSFFGIVAFVADYGFSYWPMSVAMCILTYLSWKALTFLFNVFERREDLYDEDYEPTYEELRDWDKWVH